MRLTDKVVVITGSTRGIGRAVAQICAEEGANVVVSSRKKEAVDDVVDQLRSAGYSVSGAVCDVSKTEDLEKLLKETIEKWNKLDVWINNAGISGGYRFLDEMSPNEIKSVVDINLTSVFQACRVVLPYFMKNGGIILNLSGKGGRGEASPYTSVYAATKTGVVSLTKSLAKEYKTGNISINAVLPGMVETDLLNDVRSDRLREKVEHDLPYVMKAIGTTPQKVSASFVDLIAQKPGDSTGKVYSLLKGKRLFKGIVLLMWYRLTGKISGE